MKKSYIKKGICFIKDPGYQINVMAGLGFYNWISDVKFLKKKFKAVMKTDLNLDKPRTFNEKLQWLKLYDRNPKYTMMVDKYKVRDYIEDQLGKEYLIPLIGVWDNPDDIDFAALPNQFVLKCNHNSGLGMYICKDKNELTPNDIKKIRKNLSRGLAQNYYLTGREWPYKDVPRKIVCEKYMTDSDESSDFTDYKFFCFNGYVDCVMVCLDRSSGETKFYFFDKAWNLKRLNIRGKKAPKGFTIQKPVCMDDMFDLASALSRGLPFARIDLYQSKGHIYFGEITFFPDSGFDANLLPETDEYFGEMIDLRRIIK